jgi:hypothetical protein
MSVVPEAPTADLRRLNKDGRPFKKGDIREDGFIFKTYQKTKVTSKGFYKELWLSPAAYQHALEKEKIAINKCYKNKLKDRRDLIDKIKLKTGCSICGYKNHPVALDFDHLNPLEKSFTIGAKYTSVAFDSLMDEIKKCRVLCANCHRIETLKGRQVCVA